MITSWWLSWCNLNSVYPLEKFLPINNFEYGDILYGKEKLIGYGDLFTDIILFPEHIINSWFSIFN